MGKILDCHSHFFDPFISEGIGNILRNNGIKEESTYAQRSKRGLLGPEDRLLLMDKCKVDCAAIEYHVAYQHYDETKHPSNVRIEISRFINDRLSAMSQKYPERFLMMADLPLIDVPAAIQELRRAYDLGAKGLCITSNLNGKPLIHSEFDPFWQEANRLGLPVFVHPKSDLKPGRLSRPFYIPMVGYPFDTTLTGIDLLMEGFFEKYTRLRVMLCHCGGTLPFIRKRLDMGVRFGESVLSSKLGSFYYDTAISFPKQLEFTISEVGIERMCYGSDYPFWSFEDAIDTINALPLDKDEKNKIFYRNALSFFGLNGPE